MEPAMTAAVQHGADWAHGHAPILPDAELLIAWSSERVGIGHRGTKGRDAGESVDLRLPEEYRLAVSALRNLLSSHVARLGQQASLSATMHSPFNGQQGMGALELQGFGAAEANAALHECATALPTPRIERWLWREDLNGYALTHQILAWLARSARVDLAVDERAHIERLLGRLRAMVKWRRGDLVYDLLAESIAVLLLGGVQRTEVTVECQVILREQDPVDGGWFFDYFDRQADPALLLTDEYSLNSLGPPPWPSLPSLEVELQRVQNALRGHATSVSMLALSLFMTQD